MKEFENDVANGTYEQKGWPKWSYGVSKLGINVYHSILGKYDDLIKRSIQAYVCCPGYVKTDMTSQKGHLSIEEGIKTPIYLIERPFELHAEHQGGFFYIQKPVSCFEWLVIYKNSNRSFSKELLYLFNCQLFLYVFLLVSSLQLKLL